MKQFGIQNPDKGTSLVKDKGTNGVEWKSNYELANGP